MQYPASFALAAGLFLSTIVEFVGLWALFNRFEPRGLESPRGAVYATVNIRLPSPTRSREGSGYSARST
jgi:hypothetical protein